MSSDHREGETPVPIPNTAVKPFFADDSIWVTVCESRALLDLNKQKSPGDKHHPGFLLIMINPTKPMSLYGQGLKPGKMIGGQKHDIVYVHLR